jgi:glucokinase
MSRAIVLGVDVGGTNVKAALVAKDGRVVASVSYSTEAEAGPEAFAKTLHHRLENLLKEAGLHKADVASVGIGLPAFLDVPKGIIEQAVNLHWTDVPIVDLVTAELDLPVMIDNDANLAALGEVWKGAGKNAKSALCVTLGTGVGGGIVLDGRVYRGVTTMAGEIGHISIKPDGELCNCGHYGCLETLASATALVRDGVRAGLQSPRGHDEPLSAEDVFQLAESGDQAAQTVLSTMIHWLAVGLSTVANTLNPDTIVVSGGLVNAGDALLGPLRVEFSRTALHRVANGCKIVAAELGSSAGMLGAARLAWQFADSEA